MVTSPHAVNAIVIAKTPVSIIRAPLPSPPAHRPILGRVRWSLRASDWSPGGHIGQSAAELIAGWDRWPRSSPPMSGCLSHRTHNGPRSGLLRGPVGARFTPRHEAGTVACVTCPTCNAENPAGTRFCLECGTRLGEQCQSCGAARVGEAEFLRRVRYALRKRRSGLRGRDARHRHRHRSGAQWQSEGSYRSCSPISLASLPFAEERDSEEVRETPDALLGSSRRT